LKFWEEWRGNKEKKERGSILKKKKYRGTPNTKGKKLFDSSGVGGALHYRELGPASLTKKEEEDTSEKTTLKKSVCLGVMSIAGRKRGVTCLEKTPAKRGDKRGRVK